jgi:hypothetical protein
MTYTPLIDVSGNNLIANGESVIVTRIYAPSFFFPLILHCFEADRTTPIMDILVSGQNFEFTIPFLAPRGLFITSNRTTSTDGIVFHTTGGV